ncbi:hypothetical protein DSO57_1006191 [Entomophthora muscae]|uniref:Uncharacterized protein n=1 Tax=Entomophthora muscae TaxID=34485 RepID=A0ACC2RMK6_9FUNG|nr:hypothetical protein DSO57_1006191 [Entomophthora muscae]
MAFQAQTDSGMGHDTYYLKQYLTKKQEKNKCQEEIVAKPSQVQTVTISTSNQNTAAPMTLPDLPKMDLACFRKEMIMINALLRAHPKSFRDNAQKVMMVAAVVIHMCAFLQARVDLASNKDNMLKSDNVWLAGDAVN